MAPRLPIVAAALAAGILAGAACAPLPSVAVLWLAATTLIGALSWNRLRPPVLVLVAAAGLGAALEVTERAGLPAPPPGVDDREPDQVEGRVAGPIDDAPGRRRFLLEPVAGPPLWVSVRDGEQLELLPGDRVRIRGRLRSPRGYRVPGALDMAALTHRRGAAAILSARAEEVEIVEPGATWSGYRWPTRAQRYLAGRIAARGGDRDATAVTRAMVLGDRGALAPELGDRFRAAGLSHVLAVSGLHLAVVALFAFAVVRRSWALVPALAVRLSPARAAAVIAAVLAIGFALVTGARLSTLRALIVVLAVLAGIASERRARVIDALGLAALVLLLPAPSTLFDPAFQLSFAATATLALVFSVPRPPGDHGWPRRALRWGWDLLRASLWATAATAPITALHFGSVATGGLVANLIAVPVTELIVVPVGLTGALVASVWEPLGGPVLDLAIAAAGGLAAWADAVAARAPMMAVFEPRPLELVGLLLVVGAAIAGARAAGPRRLRFVVAGAGLAMLVVSWAGPFRGGARAGVRVTFLDVGQGDAAVLELPGGAVWLVDAGGLPFVPFGDQLDPAERRRLAGSPGRLSVARFLAHRRIRRIDVVVLSHPHPDHYMGLTALAEAVDIGALWVARSHQEQPDPVEYTAILVELALRGTQIVRPALDTPVRIGDATLTVLAPRYLDDIAAVDPVREVNDNSLVLHLEMGGRSVLFAGDLEEEGEQMLAERYGRALRSDIVKVAHHGSRTSSTPALVATTSPALAVISCGVANRFDFPAPEVVQRWQQAGAVVLRTDQSGAITVTLTPDGDIGVSTVD
jgi:competence protein ComEC